MKKKPTSQAQLLKAARKKLGMTREQLAAAMMKSVAGIDAWMAPPSAKRYRNMPRSARALLAAILAQHRAKK